MPLSTIFQLIVAVSFIGGGNHGTATSHWQILSPIVVGKGALTSVPKFAQIYWSYCLLCYLYCWFFIT